MMNDKRKEDSRDALDALDNPIVKMDSVTLGYEDLLCDLSKREMDLAAAVFCLFNNTAPQELYKDRKQELEEVINTGGTIKRKLPTYGIIVSHLQLKNVAGFAGTNRIKNDVYKNYIERLKKFLFGARFPIQVSIEGKDGKKHKYVTSVTVFGDIIDIDDGESLVIPLTDDAVHVFGNFFPGQSFTIFELEKFKSLNSSYAKMIFLKSIIFKNSHGWEATKDEIIRYFGLKRGTRKNPSASFYNFVRRLPQICDEVANTGVFSKIKPEVQKGNTKGHSVIKGIRFNVFPKLKTLSMVQHKPTIIKVMDWSEKSDTIDDPVTQLPQIVVIKKLVARTVKCPKCGGKVECWTDKDNQQYYFCCEHSKFWQDKLGAGRDGAVCTFFASTDKPDSLTKAKLGESFFKVINWLLDNTAWHNDKYNVDKEYINGSDIFKYVGNYLTPKMESHNKVVSKKIKDEDDSPFPE